MIFDTHAHYGDSAFDSDRDVLLASLFHSGVRRILIPGCTIPDSRAALALAEQYPFVFAAVGLHPENLLDADVGTPEQLETPARHPRCVAIGEIGLDYHFDDSYKQLQKDVFRRQMQLAQALDLPVIVHDRDAHADSMEIIREFPEVRGVFHCYSGSGEMAKELLRRGWYLGFDGPITYKNARRALEVLELCPMDRILVETDSPYLPPVPFRGQRNDSGKLTFVLDKIAEIKGISRDAAEQITYDNGIRLFRLTEESGF